jgi:RimJ/RimL family protein N-acetyltransferase
VLSDCFEGSPGESFLTAMGFQRASLDVNRRQDLTAVDWTHLDRIRADAASHASAYELVHVAGETPDELLPAVTRLTASINDAPTDELQVEDEVFSPERIRGMEVAQQARGQRFYRLLARHRDTGELAGHTVVTVEIERPWLGDQLDTSVSREHRGNRLGLLLKAAMMQWMREEEPQLRDISTWNAESNTHMVRVNEALGYTVVARMIGWQRRL